MNNLKNIVFLILLLSWTNSAVSANELDSIKAMMKDFIKNDENGLLFGFYNEDKDSLTVLTAGKINEANDLRLGCPTTKSCISYIYLHQGIDLDTKISNWFPEENGYTKSDSISLRMLLYNTSGIQEYIKYINPNEAVTPLETIQLSYQNKKLDFEPGQMFQYSNTNYNILGVILEKVMRKDFNSIIKQYFAKIAPSLRMDDGKGNYPAGYKNPWPYHWSAPGYTGGLISNAEDAIKVFSYISNQPEFEQMTDWIEDQTKSNHLVGKGIFGFKNFGDFGTVVYYDGDMMANQMLIMKINKTIYYFHTTYSSGLENLINFAKQIVSIAQPI